jgi:two-component system LytT family sensor kinase
MSTDDKIRNLMPPGWKTKAILVAFVSTTVLGLVDGVGFYANMSILRGGGSLVIALSSMLLSWYLWIAFIPVVIWLVIKLPVTGSNWVKSAAIHTPLSFVFSTSHIVVYAASMQLVAALGLRHAPPFPRLLEQFLTIRMGLGILVYWVLVIGLNAYRSVIVARKRDLEASRLRSASAVLQADLASARLETLKAKLQPHFLFNTLNAISVLLLKGDSETARGMIQRLSELLRIVLDRSDLSEVPLREEIDFTRQYLELEQLRFGEKLTVEFDVDSDLWGAQVPHLILQPIAENAVRHGIEPITEDGKITISACQIGDSLSLSVADNGVGMPEQPGDGLGLANARERLAELYGERATLKVARAASNTGTTVTLLLPRLGAPSKGKGSP